MRRSGRPVTIGEVALELNTRIEYVEFALEDLLACGVIRDANDNERCMTCSSKSTPIYVLFEH
jgi:hypothetical protein